MKTYQDLLKNTDRLLEFTREVISDHVSSKEYREATIADEYNRRRNRTIVEYQKLLYTMSGQAVPDNYSANFKLCSNFFNRFVTQENQFLLGNGCTWEKEATKEALGEDFDEQLQDAGEKALVCAVSFGFWNLDHVDVFSLLEFAPLWDEEDGALKGGVRFWQIESDKPLRATLYEMDGYTDYMWNKNKEGGEQGEIINPKRAYKLKLKGTDADGMEIYDGENYPTFPIVPLWANKYKQSEFVGMRENIDAYDLVKSGFANDLDDASQIYWIVQNAGGMDDVDLAKFLERLKTVKAAVVDESGARAESHTIDVPYAARTTLLAQLRNDMYEDAMALDTKNMASGAITATQIEASYEDFSKKVDKYEYCVIKFVNGILALAGIDDNVTFTRSMIVNVNETVGVLLQCAQYLPQEYVTKKILNLLGDGDQYDAIQKQIDEENMERMEMMQQQMAAEAGQEGEEE